ncbi:transposase [Euzebya pacifica]|uniref:transposase n=1 Tax=Euzebya pacifica TaxID=1608957 RepID=UPI001C1F99DD
MADIDNDLLTDAATNLLTEEHRSLFRDLLQNALQTLIEEELTASIGAALHERTDDRTGQRNGHRPPRTLSTPAGDVELNRTGFFGGSLSWVVPVLVGHGQRSRRLRTLRAGCHRGGGAAAGC